MLHPNATRVLGGKNEIQRTECLKKKLVKQSSFQSDGIGPDVSHNYWLQARLQLRLDKDKDVKPVTSNCW